MFPLPKKFKENNFSSHLIFSLSEISIKILSQFRVCVTWSKINLCNLSELMHH